MVAMPKFLIERAQKWDIRFLKQALLISEWSKDPTQVGSLVVGPRCEVRSTGYNGFPRGVNDDIKERHARPAKYMYTEHAERNALYQAACTGTPTEGCTLYCASPAKLPLCADCARAAIQCGIVRVVWHGSTDPKTWREDWRPSLLVAVEMMKEAGILMMAYEWDLT